MLPTVITSSVIRGADKGASHGGVYLIDLEKEVSRQVLDWNTTAIDWSGRGGDRGLRGIALYKDRIYMAASDEIFVFDRGFNLIDSIKHPLLKHCHETFLSGNLLYISSTGYNAVMVLDLEKRQLVKGYKFSFPSWKAGLYQKGLNLTPRWQPMDLEQPENYEWVGEDSLHINHVWVGAGKLFFAGTRIRHLFEFDFEKVRVYGPIPKGAHNVRPFENGILLNDTAQNRLAILDRQGHMKEKFSVLQYAQDQLIFGEDLTDRIARQGFARGLVQTDDGYFIVGSSPATVNVFERGNPQPVKSVNLSMDLRNAIHGLELWPYAN